MATELARIGSERTPRLKICEGFCVLSETMSKTVPQAVFGVFTVLSETLPVQSVTFIERKCQKVPSSHNRKRPQISEPAIPYCMRKALCTTPKCPTFLCLDFNTVEIPFTGESNR